MTLLCISFDKIQSRVRNKKVQQNQHTVYTDIGLSFKYNSRLTKMQQYKPMI